MQKIALFDLDDTLADHNNILNKNLDEIKAPGEPDYTRHDANEPDYVKARKKMIRSQPGWWANLPILQSGWDILNVVRQFTDFRIHVLTKGPWSNSYAWTEKFQWVEKHLGSDAELTITKDKGLVYGALLVDDFPDYASAWLKYRPRGAVIMPAHEWNKDFSHPRVLRYTGDNLDEVQYWVARINKRIDEFNSEFKRVDVL